MFKFIFLGNPFHNMSYITFSRLSDIKYFTTDNCLLILVNTLGKFNMHKDINRYKVKIVSSYKDIEFLEYINFEYLISCGWGNKIDARLLRLSRKASINIHPSYLPDYKGLAPYIHAWANCEEYTGITVHIMDKFLDTGDIITQEKVKIFWYDSPQTLLYRISEQSPCLLMQAIEKLESNILSIIGRNKESGRYFIKTSKFKFVIYRFYNLFAKNLGLKKLITKHRNL
jgi:methionyl-tRNA formyltransferase